MLVYLYLFALIVGGVLLGASILLGGGDHDVDSDGDLHLDFDADADADLDGDLHAEADADAAAGPDADHALDVGGHGGADFFLWSFRSIRFWTFFLAFFGLTGLALTWLGLVDSQWLGLGLAVGMGTLTGFGAAAVLRALGTDTAANVASSSDYIGKTAKVVVPVKKGGVGKVRVQLRGTTVDVLATTDEDAFGSRDEAMIIEMDETGRARIARVDGE